MSNLDFQTPFGKLAAVVIVAIVAMVVVERGVRGPSAGEHIPKHNKECEGEPLEVDYPYHGGLLDPHACAVQCDDQIQRYIVYTNGKATQCQRLPGCLDWGEDHGVTCVIPE